MPSSTLDAIAKQTQTIAKLERKIAKQKSKARQLDTRHKILLGGLVIKAKLDTLSLEELLGRLLSIEAELTREPALLNVFQVKGEAMFLGHLAAQPLSISTSLSEYELLLTHEHGLESLTVALKKATRRKIQLGGLIIKTKLSVLTKAQLLGALVTLNEGLRRKSGLK